MASLRLLQNHFDITTIVPIVIKHPPRHTGVVQPRMCQILSQIVPEGLPPLSVPIPENKKGQGAGVLTR